MLIKYMDNEDMIRIEDIKLRVESNIEGSTFFNDADHTSILDYLSECLINQQLQEKNGNTRLFNMKDLMECFVPKKRTPVILIGGEYAVSKGFATRIINIICNEIKNGSNFLDMEDIFWIWKIFISKQEQEKRRRK